jgi:LSU ribosomal protein L15P
MRGQKARKGGSTRPGFEGGQTPLYRRLPKLKHFPRYRRRLEYTLVNLRALADLPAGSEVSLESLMERGIVTTNDGPLKILGDGEVSVPLTIRAAAITAQPKSRSRQPEVGWRFWDPKPLLPVALAGFCRVALSCTFLILL